MGSMTLSPGAYTDSMPPSRTARPDTEGGSPRRAPRPEERQRDAERSRQQLLDAAVEEFSAKGFAGARVADIAARAGVNAQLIAYYFGSKQGLYDALRARWASTQALFTAPDQPFSAVIGAYLDVVCDRPSWARLLIWQALGDASERRPDVSQEAGMAGAVEDIRRRQKSGELRADFDPETILIVLWAAVMAPITMPQILQEAYGTDLNSTVFRTRYGAQLARLFAEPRAL